MLAAAASLSALRPSHLPVPPLAAARTLTQAVSFPFVKIVGQEDMKLALQLNVVDPRIGGVLIMGDRGTGKSVAVRAAHDRDCQSHAKHQEAHAPQPQPVADTHAVPPLPSPARQVRALVDLLPDMAVVAGDNYNSSPTDPQLMGPEARERHAKGEAQPMASRRIPMIEVPLGATEDRICGTIDIERALSEGVKARPWCSAGQGIADVTWPLTDSSTSPPTNHTGLRAGAAGQGEPGDFVCG